MFSKTQRVVYSHFIIAVGSSAGGLKALQHLIQNYTSHLLNSFIIIAQHRYELGADLYFQKPAYLTQNFQVIESVVQTWASNKNNG
jgi:hypothetical protein